MSNDLLDQLNRLDDEARALIADAGDERALEAARVQLLGRKEGRLTAILRGLGTLSAEERPAVGAAANRVKESISALLDERAASLGELRRFAQRFGVAALVDRDSRRFAELGLRSASLGDDRWLERLADEPALLKVPLVRQQQRLTIGVDENEWRTWIGT